MTAAPALEQSTLNTLDGGTDGLPGDRADEASCPFLRSIQQNGQAQSQGNAGGLVERSVAVPAPSVGSGEGTQSDDLSQSVSEGVRIARHRAVRWWLVGVGILSVGMGALGVIVPGLPTTVFLIIASWCFVRSCPTLERVLIRNKFFRPFVAYMQPGAVMPTRARVFSTVAIWGASLPSMWLLTERGVPGFVLAIVLLSAIGGTIAVWRMARGVSDSARHDSGRPAASRAAIGS